MTTGGGTGTSAGTFTFVRRSDDYRPRPDVRPGGGGTSVTITGTNFTGATAVTFGGIAATSFTVNSATQITAVAPRR